jgi:outer membrane lipoprotein-sorting protein
VKLLRTLSTGSLVAIIAAIALVAGGGTAIAIAAGGTGPVPAAKPVAQAIHDGLAAPEPDGITARIKFTNRLLPSGALAGQAGSALMSGASGRLWLTNDGRGRLELQSSAGDVQIVWSKDNVTVFDASSNTVYSANLPAGKANHPNGRKEPPSVAEIGRFLSDLGKHAGLSPAQPTNVAGVPAYTVKVTPKDSGGLLGSLQLAWDAAQGVPLRAAIYARGGTKPVLALEATKIRFGPVPGANVDVSPPASAKKVDLGSLGGASRNGSHSDHKDGAKEKKQAEPTGLAAVRAAAGFSVAAPDQLAGLQRSAVRLVGHGDRKAVLVVYGEGLGAIAVVERDAASASSGGLLGSLPEVSLNGVRGHELATPLGTIVSWKTGGVSFVLAGSVTSAAAESAARSLR